MKADEDILREMAARSPKEHAPQIVERFTWVLGQVSEIEEYVADCVKNEGTETPTYIDGETEEIGVGCPHCDSQYPCGTCLWTAFVPPRLMTAANRGFKPDVHKNGMWACCRVIFNGVPYHEVSCMDNWVRLNLSDADIGVSYNDFDPANCEDTLATQKSIVAMLNRIRAFAQGHVDWVNGFDWGTEADE